MRQPMDDFEQLVVGEVIKAQFGPAATFFRYEPEPEVPMRYLMKAVERRLKVPFSIYWVTGGHPNVFCLDMKDAATKKVMFSTRYISQSSFLRAGLFDDFSEPKQLVAERTLLKTMAEMALKLGFTDQGIAAFMKSMSGKSVFINYGINEYDDIKYQDQLLRDEAYMAHWFFGIAHEMGHFFEEATSQLYGTVFSEEQAIRYIQVAIDRHPAWLQDEILLNTMRSDRTSTISLQNLRQECQADFFACQVVYEATREMMKDYQEKSFEMDQFIREILTYQYIVGIISRSEKIVAFVLDSDNHTDVDLEHECQSIAMHVRQLFMMDYIEHLIIVHYGRTLSEATWSETRQWLGRLAHPIFKKVVENEQAYQAAMQFMAHPARTGNQRVLLENYRQHMQNMHGAGIPEAFAFDCLAKSSGLDTQLLRQFRAVSASPKGEILFDKQTKYIYFQLWVTGPDEYSQPYLFLTEKGNAYFLFTDHTPLFAAIHHYCATTFIGQYQLIPVSSAVSNLDELWEQYRQTLLSDDDFYFVIEGTETFERLVNTYLSEALADL